MAAETPSSSERRTRNWFTPGLVVVVVAAALEPRLGSKQGPLDAGQWISAGTVLVFLLHGARLSLSALWSGLGAFRPQLVAHGVGFLLLPLVGLAVGWAFEDVLEPPLRLGVLYLCALPTTVTSAAVLAGMAGGNVAVAVVGCTISGLLGVVLTPAWVALVAPASGRFLGDTVLPLLLLLVAPLGVGQLCRALLLRVWHPARDSCWRTAWKALGQLDRVVVLFIVYTVFCDAFHTRLFSSFGVSDALLLGLLTVGVLSTALVASEGLGRLLRVARAERIAVLFVGSTKSLAVGAPMAAVVFGPRDDLGTVLLPLVLYHPLQLLFGSLLAARLRVRSQRTVPH
jgi:sodium/bile acid cotransporter 7